MAFERENELIAALTAALAAAEHTAECLRRENASLVEVAHDLEYKLAAAEERGRKLEMAKLLHDGHEVDCSECQRDYGSHTLAAARSEAVLEFADSLLNEGALIDYGSNTGRESPPDAATRYLAEKGTK